jgi:hypothetical protein
VKTLSVFVAEDNTAPSVPVIEDQIARVAVPFSFSIPATDVDLPEQTLTFALEPGVPPDATIDAATGWFAWMPGSLSADTTNGITVRVSDSGSPSRSTTRSFQIMVRPDMVVTIHRANDTISLSATAMLGRTYRAEYKDQLSAASWTPLGTPVVATTTSMTFSDAMGVGVQRFYRVVRMD